MVLVKETKYKIITPIEANNGCTIYNSGHDQQNILYNIYTMIYEEY